MAPVFDMYQNSPQSITEKSMEIFVIWTTDFVITLYVAGLIHPAISLIIHYNSLKGCLKVIDYIVIHCKCRILVP